MVKISEVARAAGVSAATVSRVLNGKGNVNPNFAKRVKAAAARMGYQPSGLGRNLRRRATDLLALVISDIANPFFTAVARGVEDVACANGYSVLLCNVDENPAKESEYLSVAERERVAGVILSPHHGSTDIGRLRKSAIPVVVIDRELDGVDADSVMVHSRPGARAGTDHLIDAGWLRPACITGPEDAQTARARLEGYLDAIVAHGAGEPIYRHASYRQQGGRQAVAELLDLPQPPDSLFVANSEMALGVLDELRRRGLVIGRDLGFIMFDDTPWAPLITPPVSVVAQPAYDVGAQAAGLLFEQIKGRSSGGRRRVTLSTVLIIRDSSRRL